MQILPILGDKEFENLYKQCRPMFVSIANSYVHQYHVAEDIVNDSFIRLWEKRAETQTANWSSFLYKIVVNRCLDWLKAESVRHKANADISGIRERMLQFEIASLASGDPNRLFSSEVEKIFRKCLLEMPEMTRKVFMASRFEDLTYKEIAQKLGIPVRHVTAEIQEALRLLRKSLKDYLPGMIVLILLNFHDLKLLN